MKQSFDSGQKRNGNAQVCGILAVLEVEVQLQIYSAELSIYAKIISQIIA